MSLSQAEELLKAALADLEKTLPRSKEGVVYYLMEGEPFSRPTYTRLERHLQYLVIKWNGPIANIGRNSPIIEALLQFTREYLKAYTAANTEATTHVRPRVLAPTHRIRGGVAATEAASSRPSMES